MDRCPSRDARRSPPRGRRGSPWRRAGPVRSCRDPPVPGAMGLGIDLTPQGLRTPGALQDYTVLRVQPWAPPLIARVDARALLGRLAVRAARRRDRARGSRQPRPAAPAGARRAGRRRRGRRAPGDPDALPLPALGQPHDGPLPWQVAGVADAGLRPRPGEPVGALRRVAVAALLLPDGVLRGRQRAQPPDLAAGGRRRARGGDDRDGRRDRAAPRGRRHLPGALDLRRRVGPPVHDHRAAPVHRGAARRARPARLRRRRALGLVVPQLQRRRARRRPRERDARAARRALARAQRARRRAARLRHRGRRPAGRRRAPLRAHVLPRAPARAAGRDAGRRDRALRAHARCRAVRSVHRHGRPRLRLRAARGRRRAPGRPSTPS